MSMDYERLSALIKKVLENANEVVYIQRDMFGSTKEPTKIMNTQSEYLDKAIDNLKWCITNLEYALFEGYNEIEEAKNES